LVALKQSLGAVSPQLKSKFIDTAESNLEMQDVWFPRQRKREGRLIADKLDRCLCGEMPRHAKDVGHANLREALDTFAARANSPDDAHEFRLV
jgi:hypothetical protein